MLYKSYLIEKNIKSLDKNFALFYGENLGLILEIKKKIKDDFKHCEFIIFNQLDIKKDLENIFEEISNVSLFEKEKIIFIDNATDKILEIIEEIINKYKDQKIFIFADLLDKKSKLRNFFEKSKDCAIIPCYKDNELTIKKLIQIKLKDYNGLTRENINLIVENSNLDRSKLNNEIEKISIFFADKKITSDKLEEILDIKTNNDFNLLKDEALMGNKEKTNQLLSETFIEPEKNIYYLNLINQRLTKLLQLSSITEEVNLEKKIETLKPPIFWKDKPKFLIQAKKWKESKIKRALVEIFNTEKQIKSYNLINKELLIKKLIVDICNTANA